MRLYKRLKTILKPEMYMKHPPFNQIHLLQAYKYDYIRLSSFALAINRIYLEEIPGNIAEVGVWKGETSQFLSDYITDRTIYLFDTFEGFPKQDLEGENKEDDRFRDTNVEYIKKRLKNKENIEIKKGYFPETTKGLEIESFALVILDVDLYKPTLDGLKYFYPRLNKGGYLFVHDFNNPESSYACRKAVTEFMRDKTERIIELPDLWGSVVIRKN